MRNYPKGFLPIPIGNEVHILMGGPYRNKPTHFYGVKMAAEINEPCHIDIPTRDFDVPDMKLMVRGVTEGFVRMMRGQHLYVGCMGGIGRTGLYMACMAHALYEAEFINEQPIRFVRNHYFSGAVETAQQEQYVADFPGAVLGQWLQSIAN